jgi:DNA-binding MarR family transcriptional regulator
MHDLSPEELEVLKRLYRTIRHFREMMGSTVPSQIIQAFLAVALDEGRALHVYAHQLGARSATASRHFMDLADRNRYKEDGHKLILRQDNPFNEREKLMTLTPHGKLMRRLVVETLRGADAQL